MSSIKKKRVSKKLKISWRKHVNINDVEDFLEDQRLEERLGPALSTISDDKLFTLDTNPDEELLSRAERKRRMLNKPLKCFSALEPHTKVPDPIAKRNRVRTREERKNALVKQKEEENKLKGILKAKEIQAIQDKKLAQQKRLNRRKRGEYNLDIWSDKDSSKPEELCDEWTPTITQKHNLRGVGKLEKRIGKLPKENLPVKPIENPHPGMSYNPSYEDHQALIQTVAEKEAKLIKKEEHLDRVTRGMFQKVTEEKRDSSWLTEMSEGLPNKNEPTAEENDEGNEYKSVNPPVKNAKKTVKQRRKQKEQLELALALKAKKMEKKKVSDIHQIKTIKKRIEKEEKKQAKLQELRKKVALIKKNSTKRISSTKFEEPELEFNLGMEIAGNLRNLRKEGHLLSDRFKSLQKRNILEPSVKRVRRNAKVKKYTKPGHKEDWKKTVAKT